MSYQRERDHQYDLSRVPEVGMSMLKRYSAPRVAAEMAWDHACSHPEASSARLYWTAVNRYIMEKGRVF